MKASHEQGGSYLRCPDCHKRGVSLRLSAEDHYACRYCDWYAFTRGSQGWDPSAADREQLRIANPLHELAP